MATGVLRQKDLHIQHGKGSFIKLNCMDRFVLSIKYFFRLHTASKMWLLLKTYEIMVGMATISIPVV